MNLSEWRLVAGDPTFAGWSIALGYGIVALICGLRAFTLWKGKGKSSKSGGAAPWWTLAALNTFLGVNKQMDLHTLLIQNCRALALRGGWYGHRRAAQALVFGMVCVFTAYFFSRWRYRFIGFKKIRRLALCGVMLALAYAFLRAASIFHLDPIPGRWLEDTSLWPVEVAGILLMLGGVLQPSNSVVHSDK